jgi:HSP20 family protein
MKKLVSKLLLVTLLTSSIYADANITKNPLNPFANDPVFKEFQKLQEDMNKIFNSFHQRFFSNMEIPTIGDFNNGAFSMSVRTDVVDRGDRYEIKANLPGVDKKSIKVEVKNNILSIRAETKKEKEEKKGDKLIRQERFVGSFYRAMSLPDDADSDHLKTEYKDGVLTIIIPKKGKKISA